MDRELGVLFLAFVPGMVLVIAGAISAVRQYGIGFLWCLRFEPVREKLTSMLREMQASNDRAEAPGAPANSPPGLRVPSSGAPHQRQPHAEVLRSKRRSTPRILRA